MDKETQKRLHTMLERAKREIRREFRGKIKLLEKRIDELEKSTSPHRLAGYD